MNLKKITTLVSIFIICTIINIVTIYACTPITTSNIKSFDLRTESNLQLKDVEEVLSRFEKLKGIEKTIVDCEEEYGVNAIFIISLIRNESGNGNSTLAIKNNNLGGIKNKNGTYTKFESKSECVEYMFKLLSNEYLDKDGKYFKGYTLSDVRYYYCNDNSNWSKTVGNIMVDISSELTK